MNMQRLQIVLALIAVALCAGCSNEQSGAEEVAKKAHVLSFKGRFEVGVGNRTLLFPHCVARKTAHPASLQLVGRDPKGNRLYVELPTGPQQIQTKKKLAASLVVLTLDTAIESDEEKTYTDKDLRVTILSLKNDSVQGVLNGRVSDLLRGRPHELRGKFECPFDQP